MGRGKIMKRKDFFFLRKYDIVKNILLYLVEKFFNEQINILYLVEAEYSGKAENTRSARLSII